MAASCESIAKQWDAKVGPPISVLKMYKRPSEAAAGLLGQYETDMKLLAKCATTLKEMATALSDEAVATGSSPEGNDSLIYELS